MKLEVTSDDLADKTEAQKSADRAKHWIEELDQSLKREKDFRKEGDEVTELYEGGKKVKYQFNILYSNTETLAPALYNSTPRPIVKRRFKDDDQLGKSAAEVTQRVLEFLTDKGDQDYSPFDDQMKSAVLEALVPGRGVTRFKYDAEFEPVPKTDVTNPAELYEDNPGEESPSAERVTSESVCGEEVPWNRFRHGYAKKWSGVPWVAFEHLMTREEAVKAFGDVGKLIPLSTISTKSDQDHDGAKPSGKGLADTQVELAQVFEIWAKDDRKVIFVAPMYPDAILKEDDDPLGLAGFFPCPKPLTFLAKINSLTPRALYALYEEQADELNAITIRINKIVRALKVRGGYDSTVEGMEKMLEADDNTLIPIQNVTALDARGATLEKAIWLVPIEKLITVLQQLYVARSQAKQVIYEITGIADIMRGASVASETLGAQEIKNQWGTLRLKRNQKEVMRYTRDCLRIEAEIAVSKFAPVTLKAMTGLPYPMAAEKQQAQLLLQQMQQQAQAQAAMAQAQGAPPEALQQMQQQAMQSPEVQQAQKVVAQPSWEELQALLKNDLVRAFRIDIETNSTIDAEATEDKKDISELMNAMSQFISAIGPLIADGTMPFAVAQGMLVAVVRRFRFGDEIEDQLKQMQPPPPKPDPKVEQMKLQGEMDQKRMEQEMSIKEREFALKEKEAQLDLQMKQADLQFKQQELQMKGQELQLKMQGAQVKAQLDEQAMHRDAQAGEHQLGLKMRTQEAQATAAIQRAKNPPKPAGRNGA